MTTVLVHQSQAEGNPKRNIMSCWGCGEPDQAYADKKGNIVFPNKDKPGVAQEAAEKRVDYQARYNRHNRDRSEKRNSKFVIRRNCRSGLKYGVQYQEEDRRQ